MGDVEAGAAIHSSVQINRTESRNVERQIVIAAATLKDDGDYAGALGVKAKMAEHEVVAAAAIDANTDGGACGYDAIIPGEIDCVRVQTSVDVNTHRGAGGEIAFADNKAHCIGSRPGVNVETGRGAWGR